MDTDERLNTVALASLLSVRLPVRAHQGVERRLEQLITTATGVLGVESVGLMLQDEGGLLCVVGVTDGTDPALEAIQVELHVGPSVDAFLGSAAVIVTDLADVAPYRCLWDRMARSGPRAVLSAPVLIRGAVVGILNATFRTAHQWSPGEVRAIKTYAGIVGVTVGLCAQATYWDDVSERLRARLELAAGGENRLDRPEAPR